MFLDLIGYQKKMRDYNVSKLDELEIKIDKLYKMFQKYEKDFDLVQKKQDQGNEKMYIKQLNYQLGIVARELMKVKWMMIDKGGGENLEYCSVGSAVLKHREMNLKLRYQNVNLMVGD